MDLQHSPAAVERPAAGRTWRRPAYVVAVAGALALLAVTQLPLVRGSASPSYDALQFFGPYHLLTGRLARQGSLLLWNPYTNGGTPDYAEPQVGAVSPPVLATAFLSGGGEWGFRLYWFLVWFAGGAGVIALAGRLGAPPWGAYCAACGFMLSGFYVGHAQHTPMLASASYLPWVLWRADVALLDRRPLAAVQAGALLGLSGLGGYPGVTVMNGMAAALWLVGRTVTSPLSPARSIRTLISPAILIGITAAAVLSPTYVAFAVEGRGFTNRTGPIPRPLAVANNALLPWNVATVASPAALFWSVVPEQDYSMRSVHLGAVIVVLACGALCRLERGWRLWLAACALFFTAAALSSTLPVRGWMYDYFPPARYFRHASLFRGPAMLLVTVLALLGARDLSERASPAFLRRFAVVAGIVGLSVCVVYARVAEWRLEPSDEHWAPTLALWGSVPAVLLAASLWRTPALAVRLAAAGLVFISSLDAANAAHISSRWVFDPLIDRWMALDRLRPADDAARRLLNRHESDLFNFNLLSGTPVLKGYAPFTSPLHIEFAADPTLARAAIGPDRWWFAAMPPAVPVSDDLMQVLSAATTSANAPAIVVHSPKTMLAGTQPEMVDHSPPAAGQLVRPDFTVYEHDEMAFDVSVPEAGWLIVTDRWARGWTADVNGAPAPIWGANGLWRAVRVRAGTNTVAMRYRPFGYPWLIALSWGTLVLVVITTIAGRRRRAAFLC
jgi:hypothetical protein